jgi:hypothetical protein
LSYLFYSSFIIHSSRELNKDLVTLDLLKKIIEL